MQNIAAMKQYAQDSSESFKFFAYSEKVAIEKFVENVIEMFGFSDDEAHYILQVYIKLKAVKLDRQIMSYNVVHGALFEKEPMLNAIKYKLQENDKMIYETYFEMSKKVVYDKEDKRKYYSEMDSIRSEFQQAI